jgi:hypothetical protein
MRRTFAPLFLLLALLAQSLAQDTAQTTSLKKRGWLGRLFHPFSSHRLPQYKDARLRGLALDLRIAPQIVKLSEVRQLQIKLTLTSFAKHPITLEFPTDQRIEIYLRNSAENILTKWTDNHAINQTPATVLINPQEHVEYNETIATRELTPNKVFTIDVFFPQYPELRIRQKIMTAP